MIEHFEGGAVKTEIAKGEVVSPGEDRGLEDAHKVYRALSQVIKSWQAEKAPELADWRSASGAYMHSKYEPRTANHDLGGQAGESASGTGLRPPYFTLTELPEGLVFELWQRLNAVLGIQLGNQELEKLLVDFKGNGTLPDGEMLARLHFAFSGVAELARRQFSAQELEAAGQGWGRVSCPVCGEDTRVALLLPPVGKRHLSCRVCGHEWSTKRVGCILCGSEEAKDQTYLHSDSYPGVEMVVCLACGEYFKEIDLRERASEDCVWEDVRTLPLNYAAEQWLAEKSKKDEKLPS